MDFSILLKSQERCNDAQIHGRWHCRDSLTQRVSRIRQFPPPSKPKKAKVPAPLRAYVLPGFPGSPWGRVPNQTRRYPCILEVAAWSSSRVQNPIRKPVKLIVGNPTAAVGHIASFDQLAILGNAFDMGDRFGLFAHQVSSPIFSIGGASPPRLTSPRHAFRPWLVMGGCMGVRRLMMHPLLCCTLGNDFH